MNNLAFSFAEIGAGMGGFRLAAEKLNGKCVFAAEVNKTAAEHYGLNFNEEPERKLVKLSNIVPTSDYVLAHITHANWQQNESICNDLGQVITSNCKTAAIILISRRLATKQQKKINELRQQLSRSNFTVNTKYLHSDLFGAAQSRVDLCIVASNLKESNQQFCWPKHRLNGQVIQDIVVPTHQINRSLITDIDVPAQLQHSCRIRSTVTHKLSKNLQIYSAAGLLPKIGAGSHCSNGSDYLCAVNGVVRKLSGREVLNSFGFPAAYRLLPEKNISRHALGQNVFIFIVELLLLSLLHSPHCPDFCPRANRLVSTVSRKRYSRAAQRV